MLHATAIRSLIGLSAMDSRTQPSVDDNVDMFEDLRDKRTGITNGPKAIPVFHVTHVKLVVPDTASFGVLRLAADTRQLQEDVRSIHQL